MFDFISLHTHREWIFHFIMTRTHQIKPKRLISTKYVSNWNPNQDEGKMNDNKMRRVNNQNHAQKKNVGQISKLLRYAVTTKSAIQRISNVFVFDSTQI